MPDITTSYMDTVLGSLAKMNVLAQQNADIAQTTARTNLMKLEMQEQDATRRAMLSTLSDNTQQTGARDLPSDTVFDTMQKQVTRLQNQSQQDRVMANSILQQGGSPAVAERLMNDSNVAAARANDAARQLRLERQSVLKDIGDISGTAHDEESFQEAMRRIRELDPKMADRLPVDRDVNGNPWYGAKSKRVMDGMFQSSMTASQQMDKQFKIEDELRKDRDEKRKDEDERRKESESKARIAHLQAGVRSTNALTAEREEKTREMHAKADRLNNVASKDPTKYAVDSARSSIQSAFKDQGGFDTTIDAFAADVAARANKIRAERAKSGEDVSLDDARQEAIDELRPYVKSSSSGGVSEKVPFLGGWGATTVNTYTRGQSASGKIGKGGTAEPADPNPNAKRPEGVPVNAVRKYQNGQWGWAW